MRTRPTHYEILGIPVGADDATIKSAYRKQTLVWHPDKASAWQASLSPELKSRAKEIWLLVSDAYTDLLDPIKRRQYDSNLAQTPVEPDEDKRKQEPLYAHWKTLKTRTNYLN